MATPDNTQESAVNNRKTKDQAARDRQRQAKAEAFAGAESKKTNTLLKKLLKTSKDAADRARKIAADPETKRKAVKGANLLAEVLGAVTQGSKGSEGLRHDIRRMMMVKAAKARGKEQVIARIQQGMTTSLGKAMSDSKGSAETFDKAMGRANLTAEAIKKDREAQAKAEADKEKEVRASLKKTHADQIKVAETQAKATAEALAKAKGKDQDEKWVANAIKKETAKALAKVKSEQDREVAKGVKDALEADRRKAKAEEAKKVKATVKAQAKANAAEQLKNDTKIDQKQATREARAKAKDAQQAKIAEARRKSEQAERDRDALKAQANSQEGSFMDRFGKEAGRKLMSETKGAPKTKGRPKPPKSKPQAQPQSEPDMDLDSNGRKTKGRAKPPRTSKPPKAPGKAGRLARAGRVLGKVGSKLGGAARLAGRGALQVGSRVAGAGLGTAGAVVGSAVAGLAIGNAISESGFLQRIGFYDQTDANAYSVGDLVDKAFGDGTRNVRRVAEREAKRAMDKADQDFRKMKGGQGPWVGMSDSQVKDFAKNRPVDFANYHRLYIEECRLGAFDTYLQQSKDSGLISDTDKAQANARWKQAMDARVKFKKDVVLNGAKAIQKQAAQNVVQGQKDAQASIPDPQKAPNGQAPNSVVAPAMQGTTNAPGAKGTQTSNGMKTTQAPAQGGGAKPGGAASGGSTIGTPNGMVKVDPQQIGALQSWLIQSFIPALAQAMGGSGGSGNQSAPYHPPKTPGRAVPSSPGVMR